ncbi:hypothetical protein niasHS_011700 [Heterodera schachtii]|uniref:Uncharacterized protein n=1 Tax=Heterodera schachtii TaxID=97005 RepID=A0ABD2IQ83_HETSC
MEEGVGDGCVRAYAGGQWRRKSSRHFAAARVGPSRWGGVCFSLYRPLTGDEERGAVDGESDLNGYAFPLHHPGRRRGAEREREETGKAHLNFCVVDCNMLFLGNHHPRCVVPSSAVDDRPIVGRRSVVD